MNNTHIIAVANQKGGVGKTTTSLALAGGLRRRGYNVLLGDLDPQANATDVYGAAVEGVATMYDLLVDGDTDCIQTTELGDIIAGDLALKDAGRALDGVSAAYKLRKGLAKIQGYDFIILDTPPTLSVLLTNALTAASRIVIPLTPDRFGLQGLIQLGDTIADIREYTNPTVIVDGLLLIRHDRRTHLGRDVAEQLPSFAGLLDTKMYNTTIRECIKVREAQAATQCLYTWAPGSTTAQDYEAFIDEFLGGLTNG